MGDPKKNRKKYSTPVHPWKKDRIDEEKELVKEYGLKNMQEIWKMKAPLDHFKHRVKNIISISGTEADEQTTALLSKLHSMGLVKEGAKLDDVLSLTTRDILERRLQTLLFRKGLCRSAKQARQFITHRHVSVKGQKIDAPSYLVSLDEEASITFAENSSLSNPEHPELQIAEPKKTKKVTKEKAKEEPEENIVDEKSIVEVEE